MGRKWAKHEKGIRYTAVIWQKTVSILTVFCRSIKIWGPFLMPYLPISIPSWNMTSFFYNRLYKFTVNCDFPNYEMTENSMLTYAFLQTTANYDMTKDSMSTYFLLSALNPMFNFLLSWISQNAQFALTVFCQITAALRTHNLPSYIKWAINNIDRKTRKC